MPLPPTFAADEHLGRLTRYLRLAGLDVIHQNPFPDRDLKRLAREENRVVLTMDSRLSRALRPLRCVRIKSYDVREQFLEVLRAHPANPLERAFTRCALCNTPLRASTEEEIREAPARVRSMPGGHRTCPACKRIFWQGSHYARMKQLLESFGQALQS